MGLSVGWFSFVLRPALFFPKQRPPVRHCLPICVALGVSPFADRAMATAVCGRAHRAAPDQFRGCAEIRHVLGSDVVSNATARHVKATDYFGQASRRYRSRPGARLLLLTNHQS